MTKYFLVLVALLVLVVLAVPVASYAQTTDPASWPVCRLGAAPIAPGPAPAEAKVFKTTGGPVVMSEAGPDGTVHLVRCRLAPGAEVYRGADGDLRDLPSNQPFWPVGWDAIPPPTPLADAVQGLKGNTGPAGPQGPEGLRGPAGFDGRPGETGKPGKNGFCSSKGCKVAMAIVGTVLVVSGSWYATHRSGGGTAIANSSIVITQ